MRKKSALWSTVTIQGSQGLRHDGQYTVGWVRFLTEAYLKYMPSSCNYVYSTQYYTQRMRERVWETCIIYTPMFSKIGLITPIPSRCLVEQRLPPHIMKLTDNNVVGYVVFGNG